MTSGQGLGFVVGWEKVTVESTGTPVVVGWEKVTKNLIRVIYYHSTINVVQSNIQPKGYTT